jgi:hypothetical protein
MSKYLLLILIIVSSIGVAQADPDWSYWESVGQASMSMGDSFTINDHVFTYADRNDAAGLIILNMTYNGKTSTELIRRGEFIVLVDNTVMLQYINDFNGYACVNGFRNRQPKITITTSTIVKSNHPNEYLMKVKVGNYGSETARHTNIWLDLPRGCYIEDEDATIISGVLLNMSGGNVSETITLNTTDALTDDNRSIPAYLSYTYDNVFEGNKSDESVNIVRYIQLPPKYDVNMTTAEATELPVNYTPPVEVVEPQVETGTTTVDGNNTTVNTTGNVSGSSGSSKGSKTTPRMVTFVAPTASAQSTEEITPVEKTSQLKSVSDSYKFQKRDYGAMIVIALIIVIWLIVKA